MLSHRAAVAVLCLGLVSSGIAMSRARRQEDDNSFWWLTDPAPPIGASAAVNVAPGAEGAGLLAAVANVFPGAPGAGPLSATGGIPINDLSDLASLFEGVPPGGGSCECVPYYQCKEGEIVTDGEGIIDIRFGNTLNNTGETRVNSHSQCPNFLDVCCGHPNTAVVPVPGPLHQYTPKCGHRNPTGVNARVSGFTAQQAQFGEFPWIDQRVRLGEWDTQRTYELYQHVDRRVKQVVTHEQYNAGSLSNNYALLLLESPVTLSPHIDTICLPDENTSIDPNKCFVTGWGKNEFGKEGEFQNILKKVSLPIVEHNACQTALRTTRLGKYFHLHSTFTCAGGGVNREDACKGDGGSPLVCPYAQDPATYVQVGIVSWGIGCGEPGIPGVYADVAKGIPWVTAKLKTLPYTRPN
ncbi:phenoloxidase-activating factor 2-like [Hyalella azteca]|uniref:Phenoloxidase-activating factor 2-like n=1 Tax=Hyalella azteca TaxID=294128 RepID=A0A8B7PKG4_HYAAZ|nr:phenoloxidase-activating factor 2-like [Hyalella azteca]